MTIHLIHYKNIEVKAFQSFIKKGLETKSQDFNWNCKEIVEGLIAPNISSFNLKTNDLLIVPANLVEYPLPSAFRILALLNNKDNSIESNYALIINKDEVVLNDVFKEEDLRKKYGKVYITGFGPGDPDLLTIKALNVIKNADVIFYDSLINKEFLDQFEIEKIFVGKRKGKHAYGQDIIDEMLYQSAIAGKNTVRLKGGDPFIFGRGGEEFDYLQKRFVQVEVIPGITAAFGAASSLGISLTQRLISSSVAFCTGFPKENRRIPDADTLVFYMSASNLQETAQLLIKSGRKEETPVALIRNATLTDQESQFTNLIKLANGNAGLESPMVAIVGDVAINKFQLA